MKPTLIWAAAVAMFLAAVSFIPGAQQLMKVTPLTFSQWGLIMGSTLMGTFWIELRKLIQYPRHPARHQA